MMNLWAMMRPFREVMRARRESMGLSGRQLAEITGKSATWTTELENGTVDNQTVAKLALWAATLNVDEFGLYVVIEGKPTKVPIVRNQSHAGVPDR